MNPPQPEYFVGWGTLALIKSLSQISTPSARGRARGPQARSADEAILTESIVEEARRSIRASQPAEARRGIGIGSNAGIAQGKRRSGLNWFLISLLLGPIATFLLVAFFERK